MAQKNCRDRFLIKIWNRALDGQNISKVQNSCLRSKMVQNTLENAYNTLRILKGKIIRNNSFLDNYQKIFFIYQNFRNL